MKKRRKKAWSHSEGPYGARVRVFESESGIIYGEVRDRSLPCGTRAISLRHRNRDEAVRWAKWQQATVDGGSGVPCLQLPTLSRVLALYLQAKTPTKGASEQKADDRRSKMWIRVLGASKDLSKLNRAEWQRFINARRSGAMDCHGQPVPLDERKPVRDACIDGDLTFLNSVMNWSSREPEGDRYIMSTNPARGFPVPHEKNPKRPFVTPERFEKLRAVAHRVRMVRGRGKNRRELQTYLPEIIDLCWHTGRRISAILSLRYEDLHLATHAETPFGCILFPAATDKTGTARLVPMNSEARAAIDRVIAQRPGIGKAFLFPSFAREGEPIRQDAVAPWVRNAEIRAGLPKHDGSLFHAFRRGFVTARKGHPLSDLAASLGSIDTATIVKCYMGTDMASMYRVVSQPLKFERHG